MALQKKITADNGIVTEYHRIAMLKIEVKQRNIALVHSYLSEDGRQIEKDYEAGLYRHLEEGMMKFPYVNAEYIDFPYDGEMTISKAYELLKELPQFKDAENC